MSAQPNVHVPHYPTYPSARAFLVLMDGQSRRTFFDMRERIHSQGGTPQDNRDWSQPDHWIPEIVSGEERDLASRLWTGSKGQVNPRYTTGLWLLCSSYELLMPDQDDLVYVTQKGRSFLDLPFGETEQRLDFSEGLLHLLAIVAEHGPGKRADLLPHYTDFMHTYSRVRSPRAISPSWYNRIINLVDRGLVSRDGVVYQITKAGLDYLERVATTVELQAALPVTTTSSDLRRLIDAQNDDVRAKIAGALSGIDPYQLEHIIGTLLQAMGYENVKVTQRGGDGGIDVVGDIRVGITHVREVVQVKRYKSNIQRKVLDQLRGSLHRFKAYRGTIITTGGFAKGAKDAAFEPGVPPITLIDGDRLVELLVEHNIGASRRQIDVLSFDPKAFEPEDELAEDSDFAD